MDKQVRKRLQTDVEEIPWDELRGKTWLLTDVLTGEAYDRDGDEMRDAGLYVDLGPWKCHLLQVHAL